MKQGNHYGSWSLVPLFTAFRTKYLSRIKYFNVLPVISARCSKYVFWGIVFWRLGGLWGLSASEGSEKVNKTRKTIKSKTHTYNVVPLFLHSFTHVLLLSGGANVRAVCMVLSIGILGGVLCRKKYL